MTGQLLRYDQARHALAECKKVDDVKHLRDKAEALRVYGRQVNDHELETWAAEIKARAARRIGELSKAMERSNGRPKKNLPQSGRFSKAATLKSAGLTTQAASRFERIAAIPERTFEQLVAASAAKRQPISSRELLSKAQKETTAKQRSSARRKAASAIGEGMRVGDFRKVLDDLPAESVDLIFTDPPYGRDSLELFDGLGQLASRVLVKGGSLITYFGQSLLPEVLVKLAEAGLTYRWLICVHHEFGRARIKMPRVYVTQKPLLWFSKGAPFQTDFVADFIRSKKPDKIEHEWQQSGVEAEYLIERLTPEGGLVLDPMAGSQTTLKAARKLNRRAIGVELNQI